MRRLGLTILVLVLPAIAEGPEPPEPDRLRAGLSDAGRLARERAASRVRTWARRDPAGALQLWDRLDERGRALLLRAVAGAGTERAATLALRRAVGTGDEVFGALLHGLIEGGGRAIGAKSPDGLTPRHVQALGQLRLRWIVEREMARLKSPSGLTGHYTNQYNALQGLGRDILPIFFAMVRDKALPLPGETAHGAYRSIHPWMLRYERHELRTLAAYAFAELVSKKDTETILKLRVQFTTYFIQPKSDETLFERDNLAPALAFSLFDLGDSIPARQYILRLRAIADKGRYITTERLSAWWDLGYAHIRIGEVEKGEQWYRQLISYTGANSRGVAAYNLACMFAKQSEAEPSKRRAHEARAVQWLTQSIRQFGYADWIWMEEDKDLDAIRKLPGYKSLLRYLQAQYPDHRKGRVSKKLKDFLHGNDEAENADPKKDD